MSLVMSDLSSSALPNLGDSEPLPAPPNNEAPASAFGFMSAFGDACGNPFNASQESSLDVQAVLDSDLGIFAGFHEF